MAITRLTAEVQPLQESPSHKKAVTILLLHNDEMGIESYTFLEDDRPSS